MYDSLEHLLNNVSHNKKTLFLNLIEERTEHITVILENLYQEHNISAVLRSCDVFGISKVHIIENSNHYKVNKDISLGASKWLEIIRHNQEKDNTLKCLKKLKQQGYKIVNTSLTQKSYSPQTLPINEKVALIMGTELLGSSVTANNYCDYNMYIPMHGFTESLNVSVATGIILQNLSSRLRTEIDKTLWMLSPDKKKALLTMWCNQVIFKNKST